MPNLAAFAESGVTFANHHSLYPTVSRANASSMVT
jgi:predicted AlkP superfamily pyrophosphatase or phosphodiesterase